MSFEIHVCIESEWVDGELRRNVWKAMRPSRAFSEPYRYATRFDVASALAMLGDGPRFYPERYRIVEVDV